MRRFLVTAAFAAATVGTGLSATPASAGCVGEPQARACVENGCAYAGGTVWTTSRFCVL